MPKATKLRAWAAAQRAAADAPDGADAGRLSALAVLADLDLPQATLKKLAKAAARLARDHTLPTPPTS